MAKKRSKAEEIWDCMDERFKKEAPGMIWSKVDKRRTYEETLPILSTATRFALCKPWK